MVTADKPEPGDWTETQGQELHFPNTWGQPISPQSSQMAIVAGGALGSTKYIVDTSWQKTQCTPLLEEEGQAGSECCPVVCTYI